MLTVVRFQWLLWFLSMAVVCLTGFLAGVYVEHTGSFPSGWAQKVYKTVVVNLGLWEEGEGEADYGGASDGRQCIQMSRDEREEFDRVRRGSIGWRKVCLSSRGSGGDVSAQRVEFVASDRLDEPVLVKGELSTYLDHCPGPWGCLAVEHSRNGMVSRAWPFLPNEIGDANVVSEADYPHEHPLGWSFSNGVQYFNIGPRLGNDLLVVLEFVDTFPTAGGLARVGLDGKPRWYRKDYSHHWPHVVDEDLVLVPSLRIRRSFLSYEVGRGHRRRTMELECIHGKVMEDQVNMLNGRGEVLERISIFDSIAQSHHAGRLVGVDPCNPTHLNFIHVLGEDSAVGAGLAPGDLVISLRNLNAFGILDKSDGRLKRLVYGSFHGQHSVQHWERARFVMFDNHGTDGVHGPSRVLMVDLETGEEVTLYPTERTPVNLRLARTGVKGQLDISSDRRRALVADPRNGRALEIRLADGVVLNVFHFVHDMSPVGRIPESLAERPWLFQLNSIYYADRPTIGGFRR